MKKLKKLFNSLRARIAFTLFFIVLLFLILLILLIRGLIIKNLQTETVEYIYHQQTLMDEGMALVLDNISLLYTPLVNDPEFQNLFEDDLENQTLETRFGELVTKLVINQEIFVSIMLYYQEHYYFSDSTLSVKLAKDFGEKASRTNELILAGVPVEIGDKKVIILAKPLRNLPDGKKGSLIFGISETTFKNLLKMDERIGYSFLVDEDNFLLSHPNVNYVGSMIFETDQLNFEKLPNYQIEAFDREKSIIIMSEAMHLKQQYRLNWTIVSILSYDYLFEGINHLNFYTVLIAIITLIVASILAITLSAGLVGPINRLKNKVKAATFLRNEQETRVITTGTEIQELEISFNEMMKRIIDLIEENAEEAENKRKLELFALQIQINPHFLYNTLDAIAWLAKLKKQPEIEHLVLALARFFRLSLHKGDKFISVREEIEIIKNFIVIELIRFPDKFEIEYNIAQDIEDEITMKLILQPIVENAIKHGISGLDEKGHIKVNAYGDEKYVYFEVIDDGLGFDPNIDIYNPKKHLASSGYGLKNVDERIKLEYGADCGITVDSKPNGGAKVTIKIKRRS